MFPVRWGEQPADYLFTQISPNSEPLTTPNTDGLEAEATPSVLPSPQVRYGLFSQSGEELPDTRGEKGEAIKTAINQLHPTLNQLLAAKTLDLAVNDFSSRLGARVVLESLKADQVTILSHQETPRFPGVAPPDLWMVSEFEKQGRGVQVRRGDRIQYRIHNYSDLPLYWLVLGLDNRTQFFAIYSPEALLSLPETKATPQETVAPGETLTIPYDMNEYIVRGPTGLASTYVLLSRSPFLKGLEAIATKIRPPSSNMVPMVVRLSNALEVTQQVFQDLQDGSMATAQQRGISSDMHWVLDVDQWATFRFIHQVIS
ncbi:MAG: DUF4384 domain-containing protein [Acaryochloridaceae cyanobacterium CSU_5_19]|nr:DUF4384 domain-containing protein [Acaryochloridaceae cyanobacterium CSU_5_19]